MTKALQTIAILLILSSCGVNYNLRRMAYHKRMAIAKGAEFKADTVFTDRVVITPGDSTTVFVPTHIRNDSLVYIYQDRIKISYKTIHDTLRFHVECPPDTVVIKVPVSVTETLCPPPDNKWKYIAGVLALIVALVLYFKR